MSLVQQIEPRERQRDVLVALVVHTLLHRPFTTAGQMADVLARTAVEAQEAAAACVV